MLIYTPMLGSTFANIFNSRTRIKGGEISAQNIEGLSDKFLAAAI